MADQAGATVHKASFHKRADFAMYGDNTIFLALVFVPEPLPHLSTQIKICYNKRMELKKEQYEQIAECFPKQQKSAIWMY